MLISFLYWCSQSFFFSAASAWDSALQTTDSLIVKNTAHSFEEDITDTYIQKLRDCDPVNNWYLETFGSVVSHEDGNWAITTRTLNDGSMVVYISVSTDSTAETLFTTNYVPGYGYSPNGYAAFVGELDPTVVLEIAYSSFTNDITCNGPGMQYAPLGMPTIGDWKVFVSTFPIDYPVGYEGAILNTSDTWTDIDEDGLVVAEEKAQGTSDTKKDTDGDGIDDYKESILFEDRDDVFCDTTASSLVCAYPDPLTKDLYVEIDWINDGTEIYKPTSTQLELVEEKYDDIGIKFHADIGSYGGGNELTVSSYEEATDVEVDFYKYKWGYLTLDPANFNENRYKIWRYMITGYQMEGSTVSGIAEVSGDDVFVSFGRLQDYPGCSPGYCYADFDNAIAGTIVHELGHSLCLSDSSIYLGQDSSCIFSGIDTDASLNYQSAMNYEYQFENTYSYSNGANGIGDHDDILGISKGFDDFIWKDDDSSVGGP